MKMSQMKNKQRTAISKYKGRQKNIIACDACSRFYPFCTCIYVSLITVYHKASGNKLFFIFLNCFLIVILELVDPLLMTTRDDYFFGIVNFYFDCDNIPSEFHIATYTLCQNVLILYGFVVPCQTPYNQASSRTESCCSNSKSLLQKKYGLL